MFNTKQQKDKKPFKQCKFCDGDLRATGTMQCALMHDKYQNKERTKGEKVCENCGHTQKTILRYWICDACKTQNIPKSKQQKSERHEGQHEQCDRCMEFVGRQP